MNQRERHQQLVGATRALAEASQCHTTERAIQGSIQQRNCEQHPWTSPRDVDQRFRNPEVLHHCSCPAGGPFLAQQMAGKLFTYGRVMILCAEASVFDTCSELKKVAEGLSSTIWQRGGLFRLLNCHNLSGSQESSAKRY